MKILAIFLSSLLVGCGAMKPLQVNLENSGHALTIIKDGRVNTQLEIMGVTNTGEVNLYLIDPKPSVTDVIGSATGALPSSVEITLETIELRDNVGFMSNDKLSCVITSSVRVGKKQFNVRTVSKNDETSNSFIDNTAKVILDQCLVEHGRDIANKAKNIN